MNRLSKSGIDYLDYTWNFYSGCWNWRNGVCAVRTNCWAMKTVQRFPKRYPNGFNPTFYPEAFDSPLKLRKPSRIGVAFMGDLFGGWLNPDMRILKFDPVSVFGIEKIEGDTIEAAVTFTKVGRCTADCYESLKECIFNVIKDCPQHTFIFLTKCPQNLAKWSPFPPNCWVGATCMNALNLHQALPELEKVDAKMKFISFEPLRSKMNQEDLDELHRAVNWAIVGAQTKPTVFPYPRDVISLVAACDKQGIPVFMKRNLYDQRLNPRTLRQEYPR